MLYCVLADLFFRAFGGDKSSEFRLELLGILRFVIGCECFDSRFAADDSHEDLLTCQQAERRVRQIIALLQRKIAHIFLTGLRVHLSDAF